MSVKINQVIQSVEKVAPKYWAEEWDNPGLLVGNGGASVDKVLITLDGTGAVVEEAEKVGASLILAHHPVMFRPLKNLRDDNSQAQIPIRLLRKGIAYYAAHTNLDQSALSSSLTLGKALNLEMVDYLSPVSESLIKLQVFVPENDVEKVRQALVKAGVGENATEGEESEHYAECFFQSAGVGMFRPLPGAHPALGKVGELARVGEVKLESILPEHSMERAVKAMRKAHPYESPAYDLIVLNNKGAKRGLGAVGYLSEPVELGDFYRDFITLLRQNTTAAGRLFPADNYDLSGIRLAGDLKKKIHKVAILNGSGNSYAGKALAKGADLYISGDIDHHTVLDALEGNMAVCDIGHFLSEAPMLESLLRYLQADQDLKGAEFILSQANQVPFKTQFLI